MFNTQELEVIKYGKENGKTKEEVQQALTNLRLGTTPVAKKPTFAQDAGQDIMQIGSDIKATTQERVEKIKKATNFGQVVGQSAGMVSGYTYCN